MGWETNLQPDLYFSKETFDTLYKVEQEIDSVEKDMEACKDKLLILAASNPKDLIETDCEGEPLSIEDSIMYKINTILEDYQDSNDRLFKLVLLKEYWHTRDGDFVDTDTYLKCKKSLSTLFVKDKIYKANIHKEWDGVEYYYIQNSNQYIRLATKEAKKYFSVSSKEEYGKW